MVTTYKVENQCMLAFMKALLEQLHACSTCLKEPFKINCKFPVYIALVYLSAELCVYILC